MKASEENYGWDIRTVDTEHETVAEFLFLISYTRIKKEKRKESSSSVRNDGI